MQSTCSVPVPPYLGVDLTDRYSRECREIDVCGLQPVGNGLRAVFWVWRWDRPPDHLELGPIVREFRSAKLMMVDGPQALATRASSLRVCERQSAAVGKTPDTPPSITKPFAGFIRSSLEFFDGMRREGIAISPLCLNSGVFEVYPGHIWNILARGASLDRKTTQWGRLIRKRILEALGVHALPDLPTHDQNDACLSAIMAATADGRIAGVTAASLGAPLFEDAEGVLREGPMIVPVVSEEVAGAISAAVHAAGGSQGFASTPAECASGSLDSRAEDLLGYFIERAIAGCPEVCTYAWAYRTLFDATFTKFSMAFTKKTIDVACRTYPRELPGLGHVRLDSFIVSKKNGLPSTGYWTVAQHDAEEWTRVLGNASVLD